MAAESSHSRKLGRGAQISPGNRFERAHVEADYEQLLPEDELLADLQRLPTRFLPDQTRSILSENNSPDIPFRFSINPYRGCEHGCSYCYARPTHETLGMNAGLDFESRILVKHDAPKLLREELAAPRWQPQTIAISGVTDCYQPAEREYCLTRGCLDVLREARNPTGIVTKNALVLRDLDLLTAMAQDRVIHVYLSITTLDRELARKLEPRTSSVAARLDAIRQLSAAGVPTGVMVAPIIPGLNDSELPAILSAAREAGALSAGYVLLRLPLAVRPIFEDWLSRNCPLQADRVLSLIRGTRDGQLNSSEWGARMKGAGPYAETIKTTFNAFRHKLKLANRLPEMDVSQFHPPVTASGQLSLF